jgi:hypothetical protein
MKKSPGFIAALAFVLVAGGTVMVLPGCSQKAPAAAATGKFVAQPPHGGTPVVLGDGDYHLELVRDAATGTLSAYVLDDEMEEFVRSTSPSFELRATVGGTPQTLVLTAVANSATGETVGGTSLFQAQADWLKTAGSFSAVLHGLTVRGTTFPDTPFPFPAGNDHE